MISFGTAKLAKEKGFDIWHDYFNVYYSHETANKYLIPDYYYTERYKQCKDFGFSLFDYQHPIPLFEPYYIAPPQSLLQKWLREENNIYVTITEDFYNIDGWYFNIFHGNYTVHTRITNTELNIPPLPKYEDALEFGLVEALKLI